MAISSNNVQVYTTLSKELVVEIDKMPKATSVHVLNKLI